MSALFRTLVTVLALLAATAAGAAEVTDLYEAEVPAAGRDAAQQNDAVSRALARVLAKVTGRRNPAADATVAEALKAAGRFVEQFRYRTVTLPGAAGGAPTEELRLWARFDPRVVDALARDAGFPVWGRVRPSTILWLAIERDGARTLVGSDDPGDAATTARNAADARGIPLELPLLDLEDRAKVDVMDVWGDFRDKVHEASKRYQSDLVLMARVYPATGGFWDSRWVLVGADTNAEWSASGEALDALIEEGINEAADRIASRFAGVAVTSGPADVRLVVDGVDSFATYLRVTRYLESLDGVESVAVDAVNGVVLRLHARADGGSDALLRVVRLGHVLAEVGTAPAGGADTLHFRVIP